MRTLYFGSYTQTTGNPFSDPPEEVVEVKTFFGVKPHDAKYQPLYDPLARRISFTEDAEWRESHLQSILRKGDFWDGFPISGAKLVRAEFKPGTLDQRIDLLFLTAGGELVPCELKIRGDYPDSHGQLLRYVADLEFDPWTLDRVRRAHQEFVATIGDEVVAQLRRDAFDEFIDTNTTIPRSGHFPVRAGGVIMDVEFKPTTIQAVRYLNQRHGFKIDLVEVRALVDDGWRVDAEERWMRVDFVPVPIA